MNRFLMFRKAFLSFVYSARERSYLGICVISGGACTVILIGLVM